MQEPIKQMLSLNWWIGVVVVGILINLAAAYLKPRIDSTLGSVSDRYRKKNEQRAKARAEQIEVLRSNPHEQIMFGILINYQYLSACYSTLFGVLLIIIAIPGLVIPDNKNFSINIFIMIMALLWVSIGFGESIGSILDHNILREARKSPTSKSHEDISRNVKKESE
jgi:hypothetical protein